MSVNTPDRVGRANLFSPIARDKGINIGADFMTMHDSVTVDTSALASVEKNLFMSNLEYGQEGDVYNVQLKRDGKWSNIGVTGVVGQMNHDESRTVHGQLGSATVTWKAPAGLTAGTYKVRVFNETKNLAGPVERDFVVTGDAGPQPSASASVDPGGVSYANCDAVRAAGKAPLHRGEPGYTTNLDSDNDGVGCETGEDGSRPSLPKSGV